MKTTKRRTRSVAELQKIPRDAAITALETAGLLAVSYTTVLNEYKRGRLLGFHVGRLFRTTRGNVDEYQQNYGQRITALRTRRKAG